MPYRTTLLAILLPLGATAGHARSVPPPPVPAAYDRYTGAITAAQACLDAFMAAFQQARHQGMGGDLQLPHVRLASNTVTVLQPGQQTADMFTTGALADWDHSEWARRAVIHAGPDKVHINTRFNRYRKDGSLISGFDSIYIVTQLNGHWGIQARSSFAP